MDITVSIVDFRSLSQSDLIMRNLFSLVQIGQTKVPGNGVLVQAATFHSGSSENPLVVTLKNSQTETVMYVRNIPISAVLGQRGSFEQWVAVYPPGDPQNLHFDVSAMPKEGQPQVLIRVSIEEEMTASQSLGLGAGYGGGHRLSTGSAMSPLDSGRAPPAFSGYPTAGSQTQVDDLRRSVDSLQAELAKARQGIVPGLALGDELDITRASSHADDMTPAASYGAQSRAERAGFNFSAGNVGGNAGARRGSSSRERGGLPLVLVDSTVREKEEQARRIKKHVTMMTSAAKQAQDMTRTLQENLRTLESLRRQFQDLEMQLAEQRAATKILERDRDQFQQEEADLVEQIRNREIAEQETRNQKNEVDRELQRLLGETQQQKMSMETSSSNFNFQTNSIVSDLDCSKREVSSLQSRLQSKKSLISELEVKQRTSEDNRMSKEAAEREEMRALLDQTRRDLSSARSGLEDSKRRYQNIQLDSQQVTSQLDSSQREVQALKGALHGSSGREASKDARMEFEKKKADLESHVAKVKILEGKLAENREQLSDMSMKIANLHNEARDKEIAARRCEDLQADLQRKLDAHQRMKTAALIEIEAGEGQVSRAEKAHNQAKTWWEELEAAVAKDSKDSAEAALLAKDIEVKREQLAKARQDVQELVQACEELDTTAITRRAVLGERQDALEVAKARVEELSRQLAQANSEIVGSDGMLKGLEQDAAECLANIEDAKRRLKQKQDDASQFEINTTKAADLEKTRAVELEKTVDALRIEIENASNGSLTAQQVSAVVGYSSIEETGPLADLVSAKADCEREVKVLSEENEAILAELKAGTAQKNSLEQTSLTHASDLETTRGKITSKLREVADLEAAYKKEILQMEADQAALESQKEESHRLHKQLTEELEEERLKRNGKLDSISKARQQKALLDSALEKALAERAESVGKGEDNLMSTEARLKILTNGFGESSKRFETNASRLASAERTRSDLGLKLATISEELSSGEDMLQETMTCLSAKKSEFDSLQEDLKKGQGDSANADIQSQRLQSEISILEAKLKPLEAAAGDLQSLEESHRDLSEQLRVDGDRHKELMTIRSRELDNTRTQIEQQRNLMLQQKDTEIQNQITQIDRLENEKSSLTQQVERLAMEKQSFTDNSTKHEKSYGDYAMEHRMKSKEGDVLEGTVREMKALSNQLEEKEGELQRTLATVQTREGLLRSEAQESLAQLGEVRRKMESADAQAQRLLEAEVKNLEQQREVLIQHKVEKETLNKEMEDLKAAEAKALEESQAITAKTDEIGHTLLQAKSAFAETTAERERCHLQMLETSKKVKALQGEKEQRMSGARQASAAKNSALELEEQLQQASDGLAEAQELLRDRKREEEELRQEIQKLQEQVRATQDKMAYQMEHSDLQYETIQQLEDERKRVESETEDLTIRLHDAEQQKEHMQNQNLLLQQQVEGLDRGALQEWADQVPRPHASAEEVARYTDELEATKARVEALTQMKKEELDKVKAEHQDTCNRLRDRIAKVQAQIEVTEARFEKREADRAKKDQREMVDAPSSAVPGLVVPQRPLPANAGRRKALLVGINYATSHAPLKGCINDVWNLQCLLRYTMQYQAEQLNLLLDGADGTPPRKESAPTKANILAGLQWLITGARPGDSLMFVFCGYGTQHPRSPGSDQHEAYLVPSDFAADLPSDFFHTHKAQAATARSSHAGTPMGTPIVPSRGPTTSRGAGPLDMTQDGGGEERGPGYRLVSLIELQDVLAKLPPAVRITLVFDCCYSLVPNLHPKQSFVITFPKVERGPDESAKLRDSLSRPRFLQLPVLPVRHTPRHLRASVFPGCWVYSFSACGLQEWCAEFPIEGTVQGAFTWAFLKAFAACHFHCSVYQMMRMLTKILTELRTHFKRIEQTPTLLHSQSAGMNDIVLGT